MSLTPTSANWMLVNEFGHSKVYLDAASIERAGANVRVIVRYVLNPQGVDKRDNRPVAEMLNLEEYEIESAKFRLLKITFVYGDATQSEPLLTDNTWKPATGGNEKTLNFLQQYFAGRDA
jgi:hypothetical protein